MAVIALVPGLIAAWVSYFRSPEKAFLWVYIPVLLTVPEYYRWTVPLLPKMTPSHSAIVAIIVVAAARHKLRWKVSPTDFLMLGLVICIAISEYTNAGYKEAQNLTFDMLAWLFFPYLAAKVFIEPLGLRLAFVKRLVFVIFMVAVVSVYEFRLGKTAFRIPLDPFFAGQGSGWVTTFRWGFARIAGPYGHAILAGVIFVIGYRLQRWLEWGGHWETQFKRWPKLPLSKARIITLGLIAGSIMTMCRGPWLGGVLGAIIVGVGRSPNRKVAIRIALAVAVVIGIPVGISFHNYVSVGRAGAKTVAQESAAYRKELVDKYTDIALEKSAFGWGRNTWPKVDGMVSIDNYYLQLTLMHGLTALTLFCAIIITMIIRLGRRAGNYAIGRSDDATLALTLLSIYAAIAFSIATVYMGTQLVPLFGVLTGWSEGFLLAPIGQTAEQRVMSVGFAPFRFHRVVT